MSTIKIRGRMIRPGMIGPAGIKSWWGGGGGRGRGRSPSLSFLHNIFRKEQIRMKEMTLSLGEKDWRLNELSSRKEEPC